MEWGEGVSFAQFSQQPTDPFPVLSLDYLSLGDGIHKEDKENISLTFQWLEPLSQAP